MKWKVLGKGAAYKKEKRQKVFLSMGYIVIYFFFLACSPKFVIRSRKRVSVSDGIKENMNYIYSVDNSVLNICLQLVTPIFLYW